MGRSIHIPTLPRFVPPMLAQPGFLFDSSEHLFEVKWDGTRVLAFVDSGGYRLVNRHRVDVTERFPELGLAGMAAAQRSPPKIPLTVTRKQAAIPSLLKPRSPIQQTCHQALTFCS